MATNPNFSLNKDANLADVNAVDLQVTNNVLAGGTLGSNTGTVTAGTVVTVVDAVINPAVVNTKYLLGPNTATRAITMPAGTTAGQTIVFKLVGQNTNNNNWVITCPVAMAARSTLIANLNGGDGPTGAVAGGANTILTIAGDTNGGGGIGSVAVYQSTGVTWHCSATLVDQGNGSAADASAFS